MRFCYFNIPGGALGKVEVFFVVHNGTATFGKDYSISKGSVIFTENQKEGNITVPIIDDSDPEQQETFTVTLGSVSGGASLGTKKSANVIIVISDNPSGLLGFVNATELVLPNPNVTQSLMFGVARNGGAQGAITVKLENDHDMLESCIMGWTKIQTEAMLLCFEKKVHFLFPRLFFGHALVYYHLFSMFFQSILDN